MVILVILLLILWCIQLHDCRDCDKDSNKDEVNRMGRESKLEVVVMLNIAICNIGSGCLLLTCADREVTW